MSSPQRMRVRISGATSTATTTTGEEPSHTESSAELEVEIEVPSEDGLHPSALLALAFAELDNRLTGLAPRESE